MQSPWGRGQVLEPEGTPDPSRSVTASIAEAKRLQSLATLYGSAQRFAHSLDPREIGASLTDICVGVLGATTAWVGRKSERGRLLRLAFSTRSDLSADEEASLGPGAIIAELMDKALASGHPVLIPDPSALGLEDDAVAEHSKSACIFPLIARDSAFGGLVVFGKAGFLAPETSQTLKGLCYVAGGALANAQLYEEAQQRLRRLDSLRAIDMAILQSFDLGVTLDVVTYQVTGQLRVDAAAVLLLEEPDWLTYAAGRGFSSRGVIGTGFSLFAGMPGQAARERRTVAAAAPGVARLDGPGLLASGEFVAYAATPLVAKGEVKGVLEVFSNDALEFEPEWLRFLEALAGQAAMAIENAQLIDRQRLSNLHLTEAYDATLRGWSRFLELRDRETQGHTERVADTAVSLARNVGIQVDELVHLRRGALLHDIGKMGVPDAILHKPGPLDDEEWKVMRQHPVYSYELLSPIPYLRPALDIPYCHHEKWDGSGYPRGLAGSQIPLGARVFAVVDVWDALTSDRPYRSAWSADKVSEHIEGLAGAHFDPDVADAFLAMPNAHA